MIGFIALFKNNRKILGVTTLFLLAAIVSDIFSTEIIPDVHYFGLGHPNTLRVSGFIPIILFAACFGIQEIYKWFNKHKVSVRVTSVTIVVIVICSINMVWYFNQVQLSRINYLYNYKVNQADLIQLIKYLNNSPFVNVSVTNTLAKNNEYLTLFLNPTIKTSNFDLISPESTMEIIRKNDATVIEINENTLEVVNTILAVNEYEKFGYTLHEIKGIVDQPDFVIFEKSND
jgi:hypothetical protein